MFEIKLYQSLAELISDTRKWLDENFQNRPFKFVVYESENDTIDCDGGNTIEGCLEFLDSNISDYLNNKNDYLVMRKNKVEKEIQAEETIFFVTEKNNYNESIVKNIDLNKTLDDVFYKCKAPIVAIQDGRFSAVCMMECLIDNGQLFSEKEITNFSSLEDENRIFELYDLYQKDCMQYNKQVFNPESSDCESLRNLKNNLL